MNRKLLALLVAIAGSAQLSANCEELSKAQKFSQSAQDAFDNQRFAKAEQQWVRALSALDTDGVKDATYATILKKLGNTARKRDRYADAADYYKRAEEIYQTLGAPDPELITAKAELSAVYKLVDADKLGKTASDALKKKNAVIDMCKTDGGSHVHITVPDRIEEHIDGDPSIDGVAIETDVTFDVIENGDGSTKFSNIKGFRMHSVEKDMWVNLLEVVLKGMSDSGKRQASVTAGKMGVTRTVEATLPSEASEPIDGFLSEMKSFALPVEAPPSTPSATTEVPPSTPAATTEVPPATPPAETTTPAGAPPADTSTPPAGATAPPSAESVTEIR